VEKLGLGDKELETWRQLAQRMYVPQDPASGLIEQFAGFFQLQHIDLKGLEPRSESLQAILGRAGVQQAQVLKQPDVLMLLFLLRDRYDERVKRINWDYYEPRTDHEFGSSLGPAIHAALASELGEAERAYRHFMRAALVDLEDLRGNGPRRLRRGAMAGAGVRVRRAATHPGGAGRPPAASETVETP